MSTQNNNTELLTELAYEFANTLLGNTKTIIKDRNDNPDKIEAFHVITANCNGRILRVVNGKPIYPNWFLDSTKNPTTNKYSNSHFIFRKAVFDILENKIGKDHNIYIKYIIVNKEEKIFSIHFLHNRKKESTAIADCSWITHTTGEINCNDTSFIQYSSVPSKKGKSYGKEKKVTK